MNQQAVESCTCDKCVKACEAFPGWFLPGEAEKAAELLGVNFETFERNLVLDSCSNPYAYDAPYVYTPRKVGVDAGLLNVRIRSNIAHHLPGQCVFLKDRRCSIHEAKPHECRVAMICKGGPRPSERDYIEQAWIKSGAPLGMRPEV